MRRTLRTVGSGLSLFEMKAEAKKALAAGAITALPKSVDNDSVAASTSSSSSGKAPVVASATARDVSFPDVFVSLEGMCFVFSLQFSHVSHILAPHSSH